MARKKNKAKRKRAKTPDDEKLETHSDPGPNRSPNELDYDPEEGPSQRYDDLVRVPPLTTECTGVCKQPETADKTRPSSPQGSDNELSFLRYLTRKSTRRSRLVSGVPLNHIEPLLSFNRRLARFTSRSLKLTPQQRFRAELAAELCPCKRAPNAPGATRHGAATFKYSRPPAPLPAGGPHPQDKTTNGNTSIKTGTRQDDAEDSEATDQKNQSVFGAFKKDYSK